MHSQLIHKYIQNTGIGSWDLQEHKSYYGGSGRFWGVEAYCGMSPQTTGKRMRHLTIALKREGEETEPTDTF